MSAISDDGEDYLPPLPQILRRDCTPHGSVDVINDDDTWYAKFIEDYKTSVPDDKMHDLVLDYLVGEGFGDVATVLREEAGREQPPKELTEIAKLDERSRIRDCIHNGQLLEAITEVNNLCPGLLDKDKELHFAILRQHLVELIRKKADEEALDFAQKYLADKCDQSPDQLQKLEQTYALLAFDEPEQSPFGHLMQDTQKQILAHQVNQKLLVELRLTPQTRFEQLLKLMVWNQAHLQADADIGLQVPEDMSRKVAMELFGKATMDYDEVMEESL